MTITKQRVEKIIYRHEMGLNSDVTAEEVYDLAVLALNLSNIAKLKRYELDMDGCDSFGQDCGADMTEDSDGDYVLFDDVVKLFDFDTTTQKLESPAMRQPVNKIDYQELREAAERAIPAMERLLMLPADDDLISEQELKDYGVDIDALNAFKFLTGPETVLALLDELERNQQYIKSRDQENEDIALTVGKLRVELEGKDSKIANLTAERDALREGEMGDARHSNTRAAADIYFQLVEECEIPAGGSLFEYVDDMREKLEAAEKRIAELESNEVREVGNQFLVVRHPGKTPVIKHCTGDLEEFLRKLIEQDPLVTIDIITHRYYGIGGQWVQDAVEYLHMMSDAGIRIKGGE